VARNHRVKHMHCCAAKRGRTRTCDEGKEEEVNDSHLVGMLLGGSADHPGKIYHVMREKKGFTRFEKKKKGLKAGKARKVLRMGQRRAYF